MDEFIIIIPPCKPDEAKKKFIAWLEENSNIEKLLRTEDILIDHIFSDVDGKKICLDRYRIRKKILKNHEK